MRIAQATFYQESHPGAFLQAYALQRALKEAGHKPELIRYRPIGDGRVGIKRRIGRLLTSEHLTDGGYAASREVHLTESHRCFHNIQELGTHDSGFDAMVCGSDQIWNPHLFPGNRIDPFYLLRFRQRCAARIAYAASTGGWTPSHSEREELKEALEPFTAISVREPSAKKLLEELLGREIHLVADPTLLHEHYTELCSTPIEDGDFVLLYGLQWSELLRRTATAVAGMRNSRIVTMGGTLLPWKRVGERIDPRTPGEWLGAIRRCGVVVTNSYHGLIFSILMGKRVYVPLLGDALARRNERMEHLCSMLGIRQQVIVSDPSNLPAEDIDWKSVKARIAEVRRHSLGFLSDSLRFEPTRPVATAIGAH